MSLCCSIYKKNDEKTKYFKNIFRIENFEKQWNFKMTLKVHVYIIWHELCNEWRSKAGLYNWGKWSPTKSCSLFYIYSIHIVWVARIYLFILILFFGKSCIFGGKREKTLEGNPVFFSIIINLFVCVFSFFVFFVSFFFISFLFFYDEA